MFIVLAIMAIALFNGVVRAQNEIPPTSSKQAQKYADSLHLEGHSDAEILINFSRVLERDKVRLILLKEDSSRIEPIFQEKSLQFFQIETQLDTIQDTAISSVELAMIELDRQQLKGILDFMLERRRSISQQIKILERKIEKEEELIDFVIKGETANILEITEQNERQKRSENIASDTLSISDSTAVDHDMASDPNQYNWQVVEEERALEMLKAKYEIAKKKWQLAEQLLALNQDELTVIQSFIRNTTSQIAEWNETLPLLEDKLITLQKEDSAFQLQQLIQNKFNEIRELKAGAESILSAESQVLVNLEARVDRLSSIKPSLSDEVADASKRIERKIHWIAYLRSPFAPSYIYSFLVNKGPRIIFIILFLFLTWAGGRWLTVFILKSLSFSRNASKEDHNERIETLSRAIRSGLTVVVLFIGFLAILSELGIDISVLLGGAAVFSLVIAFGAQSLVKDYFSGFMILSENQYRVGNVIKVNQISGVVEDISLRTTILRDLEGVAHFIPHGEITTVSNLTHRWSRVALDIRVSYKENVDRVIEVIMEIAQEMQEDGIYKKLITDKPEMLGVDAFAESALIIKVLIKTKPLQQWLVKREFLRRLKNRFDALGIEIPFPQRTIYHKEFPFPDQVQLDQKVQTDKTS